MDKLLISVIIPTYNSGKYIKKTIDSVLGQNYDNFELIIIDDGSVDDTLQICNGYENINNIKILKHSHCGNIAYLRNTAAKTAKGDYFSFLDSDDVWESDKLQKQIEYLDNYNFICSNAVMIDENDNTIMNKYFEDIDNNFELSLCDLLKENYIITSSVVLKKDIFFKYGLFDEDYGNLAEDYSLWLKIAEENSAFFINEPLVRYRRHISNISSSDFMNRDEILLKTITLRSKYINNNSSIVRQNTKIGILKIYRFLSSFYLHHNKYKKSIKCMVISFRYCGGNSIISVMKLFFYFLKIFILNFTGGKRY